MRGFSVDGGKPDQDPLAQWGTNDLGRLGLPRFGAGLGLAGALRPRRAVRRPRDRAGLRRRPLRARVAGRLAACAAARRPCASARASIRRRPRACDLFRTSRERAEPDAVPRAGRFAFIATSPNSFQRTQPNRGASWITFDLLGTCAFGTTRQRDEFGPVAGQFDGQPGRRAGRGRSGELALDDPVLQRLIGHHGDPAARAQGRQRGGYRLPQRLQLGVDRDAQRLEGALGRVTAGASGRRRDRLVEQFDELTGRRERRAGATAHDERGDTAREALLAELAQQPRQRLLVVGVQDLRRGQLGFRVHPHVQWRVGRIGEAALGTVELHRRHAEIEQDRVDLRRRTAHRVDDVGYPVVAGAHQRDAVGERRETLTGDPQRVGVAVQADQP